MRLARGAAIGFIRFYQWFVAPLLPRVCRFAPSCSEYAVDAISGYGLVRGGWLAARRILRCHPWGGSGYDPVPDAPQGRSGGRPSCGACR